MENEKIRFHVKFYKSLTDFSFYEKFRSQSVGKAIVYMLLLSLTLGVLWTIKPIYGISEAVSGLETLYEQEVPEFTFSNGELSVEGNMPIVIDEGTEVIIIDTSGKTDASVLDKYDKGMFINKDKLVQKKNEMQTTTMDFKQIVGVTFDKDDVKGFIPLLKFFNIIVVIALVPYFFVSKLIAALILAIIGLVLCSIKKTQMSYGDLYKLSIYALTLPIIVKVIKDTVGVSIPYFWAIYLIIGAVYLWYAIAEEKAPLDVYPM